jgi:hypothetical protein
MPSHIQTLRRLTLAGCLFLAACSSSQDGEITISTTESGMKVRTTIQKSWNTNAKAVANKVYNGAWEFRELEAGGSVVVRVYRNNFLIGTFDGASYYEIVFQIPADVSSGQEVLLRPIPRRRPTKKLGEYDRLAPMKDGEITAFKYGNPMMGWMKQSKIAKVKIASVGDKEVVIHLRLKADLDESWDFDMDQQFTLKVISSKNKREQDSAHQSPTAP